MQQRVISLCKPITYYRRTVPLLFRIHESCHPLHLRGIQPGEHRHDDCLQTRTGSLNYYCGVFELCVDCLHTNAPTVESDKWYALLWATVRSDSLTISHSSAAPLLKAVAEIYYEADELVDFEVVFTHN